MEIYVDCFQHHNIFDNWKNLHTNVVKRTVIMVFVIIVALTGSHVIPEYVNFTSQVRIDSANNISSNIQSK